MVPTHRRPRQARITLEMALDEIRSILSHDHDPILGDFVWTGMDYIGESALGAAVLAPEKNPFGPPAPAAAGADAAAAIQITLPKNSTFARPGFPWFISYCGDIDLIGNKKAPSYLRDVVWDRSPLEMAVVRPLPPGRKEQIMLWGFYDELRSWTWPGSEGLTVTVRVYSKLEKVNVTLNGKPIEVAKAEFPAPFVTEFALPYAPGELKASAIVNGKLVEQVLRTTGNPSRIALRADRAQIRTSRNDLSYVMAELQDDAGNPIEDGVAEIQFSVKGQGELAACQPSRHGQLPPAPSHDISRPLPCHPAAHRRERHLHARSTGR